MAAAFYSVACVRLCFLPLALLTLVACRASTEIDVTVTTDVPCDAGVRSTEIHLGGADLFEGGTYTVASSSACESRAGDNYLGKLVVTPSAGESDRVEVLVVTGINQAAGTCIQDNYQVGAATGCIVERRSWTFVPHTTLLADILMPEACERLACGPGTTCTAVGTGPDAGAQCSPVPACTGVCGDGGGGGLPETGGLPEAGPDALEDTGRATPDAGLDAGDASADATLDSADSAQEDSSTVDSAPADTASPEYTVGGTVTGLPAGAVVVIQDNGTDTLGLTANGAFVFATPLPTGAAYAVTVLTQPGSPPATCIVTHGMGTIASASVSSVVVSCVASTQGFSVGGTVSGLYGGDSVLLEDNSGDNLFVTSNGSFTFPTALVSGATYAVTVGAEPYVPAAQVCTLAMEAGTVNQGDVTTVVVTCATASFTIGGTVTGLAAGESVLLQDNVGDSLTVSVNGPFSFATPLPSGSTYDATVETQPTGHPCDINASSGQVSAANVNTISVNCGAGFTVGGTVQGLVGSESVVLEDNGGDQLSVSANGSFAFPTPVQSGAAYAVTVLTSPSSPVAETCNVTSGGSGTIGGADVTTVKIVCRPTKFTIGGTVAGLTSGGRVVLMESGGGAPIVVTVSGDGSFTFPGRLPTGATYDVTVVSSMPESCTVAMGGGTVATANVAIAVVCGPLYTIGGTVSGLVAPDGGSNAVTLLDNDASLVVGENGAFIFPGLVPTGASYDITVQATPSNPAESCVVTGGVGTVGDADVASPLVSCTAGSSFYTVGGTVLGLASGDSVVLEDNGGDSVILDVNGPFTFPALLLSGNPYDVTVLANPTSPAAQTCQVTMGTGTVVTANVTAPVVTCVSSTFTIGGTLSGLAAGGAVVLQDNGGDNVTLGSNGAFSFVTAVAGGHAYSVSVLSNPTSPSQTCTVSAGSGTVGMANITGVQVACITNGPRVLASGLGAPAGVAVDFANVYWTDTGDGNVLSIPRLGGTPTTLASGQNQPFGITVDATSVYWTNEGGTVMSVPVGGGPATTLASAQSMPFLITVDSSSVYWTNAISGGSVMSVPLLGGVATTLASGQNLPSGIAVDATSVYWTEFNAGNLWSVPLGGGTPSLLASSQGAPNDIGVDATSAYWTDETSGAVMSVAKAGGGMPVAVVSGLGVPFRIAVDATAVYWTDIGSGDVASAPKGGGAATVLASGLVYPRGIVVDATSVYFADYSAGNVQSLTPK